MPYLTQAIAYNCPFLDKRVKLLPCQKEMILFNRDLGSSQRALARMFGVSRRLITMILDPQKAERNRECRQENGGWKQYYVKEDWSKTMKAHRRRKHEILKGTITKKG